MELYKTFSVKIKVRSTDSKSNLEKLINDAQKFIFYDQNCIAYININKQPLELL